MKYCFILGSNSTLSIAELYGFLSANKYISGRAGNLSILGENVLLLDTDKIINAAQTINKLGGIIKIGEIISSSAAAKEKAIIKEILPALNPGEGKFKFGLSNYSRYKLNMKVLGMEIKKYLRENNVSCRWVVSREPVLSSVVVEQNKLFKDRGIEILIFKDKEKLLIGKTLAVQPFKELSFRDYGRPARDDFSGMLPPKLAQIMINLAIAPGIFGDGGIILDPFCGSGTILTEAMLMGIKNVIGSDISEKAVEDTKKNIEWMIKNYELRIMNYELFNRSVLELSKFIKPHSIGAIVTEPYLGPQRGKVDIKKSSGELEDLYSKSLLEFKKVLKPGGRVVIVWPVFIATQNSQLKTQNFITPNLNGFKIINPIPENLRDNKNIHLTDRNTIIYGREGQKIWREIVVLE